MARLVATFVAALALAGCDLGGGATERHVATSSEAVTTPPAQTVIELPLSETEVVVRAIRSCEVKRIAFLHNDITWVTFRGGETVRHGRLDTERLERAAWNHASACRMVIAIE